MEAGFFAVIGGLIVSVLALGLWSGISLAFGISAPTPYQAQGVLLLGGCGAPLLLGILVVVIGMAEAR